MRLSAFLFILGLFSFTGVEAAALQLNGMASYWSGASEVYIASLWVESPSTNVGVLVDSAQYKRMQMRVTAKQWRLRNFEKEWLSAIEGNNSNVMMGEYREDVQAFVSILKGPLQEGDLLLIDYDKKKTTVTLNQVELLTFQKAEVFNVFLRTWLGPQLPYASFREQILGSDNSSLANLQMRFNQPVVTDARKQEIEAWQKNAPAHIDSAEEELAKRLYRVDVTRSILHRVVYPSRALRAKEEGTSIVKLSLGKQGTLIERSIYESSGYKSLDDAALRAIASANFAHFPEIVTQNQLEFLVPVRFVLP